MPETIAIDNKELLFASGANGDSVVSGNYDGYVFVKCLERDPITGAVMRFG